MNKDEIRIRKKIGQVVCCGFFGTTLNDNLREMINKYYIGNIIYFSRNYENPVQMLKLNKDLYQLIEEKTGFIPLTAIDQEGGNVTRLMNGVTFPPSPLTSSLTKVSDAPYNVGKIIGRDMISLGLNLNLAPCLDINSLDPFYQSIRCYGTDPDTVTKATKEFINGVNEYGVLSCLKHFPGSGEGKVDTHFNMSLIERSVEELENRELIPFINNITAPAIMTTHTIFKALDNNPATLSYKVITEYLKNKLNYQGIVITDALEMNAIKDYFGSVEASLLALNAGADMILCCHDRDIQIKTMEYLYNAVINGDLLESSLDEKIERIKKQKDKLIPYLNKYFYNLDKYEVDLNNNKLSYEIVKNSFNHLLGSLPKVNDKALFLAPELYAINGAEDVFDERSLPKSLRQSFKNDVIVLDDKEETFNKLKEVLNNYENVIAFSYNVNINKINTKIINYVNNNIDTNIISFKGLMDINLYDDLKNYSVLYEYTPNSIKTIIEILKK